MEGCPSASAAELPVCYSDGALVAGWYVIALLDFVLVIPQMLHRDKNARVAALWLSRYRSSHVSVVPWPASHFLCGVA